jgi:alpha-mannosidase
VRPANLVATASYREGNERILRFYEAEGKKTRAVVTLPRAVKGARQTDLNGRLLAKLPPGKTLGFNLRPWEIVTLRWK